MVATERWSQVDVDTIFNLKYCQGWSEPKITDFMVANSRSRRNVKVAGIRYVLRNRRPSATTIGYLKKTQGSTLTKISAEIEHPKSSIYSYKAPLIKDYGQKFSLSMTDQQPLNLELPQLLYPDNLQVSVPHTNSHSQLQQSQISMQTCLFPSQPTLQKICNRRQSQPLNEGAQEQVFRLENQQLTQQSLNLDTNQSLHWNQFDPNYSELSLGLPQNADALTRNNEILESMGQLNRRGQDSRRIENKTEDISEDDITLLQLQRTNFINKNIDICEKAQRQAPQEQVSEQLLQAQMMPPHHKYHYNTAIQEQSLYDTTTSESEAWSSSSVSLAQPWVDSFDPDLISGAEKCTNWPHYPPISKQLPWIESKIPPVALNEQPRHITGQKNDTKQNSSYSNNDDNSSPSLPCQRIIPQLECPKRQDCVNTFTSIGSNIKSVQETNFEHNLDDLVGEILNSLPHSQQKKTPKIDMKKDLIQKGYKANSLIDTKDMYSMCEFPLSSQSNFPESPESLIPPQYFNPLPQYSNQQGICNLKSKWPGGHDYGQETSNSPQDTIYRMNEPPLDNLYGYKQQPGPGKNPVIKTNKFGGIRGAPSLNTSYWDLPLDPLCTASFYEDWPTTQNQKYIWAQQISQITSNLKLHDNPNVMSQHSLPETNTRESTSNFPTQEVPIILPDTAIRNQNTHRREKLCGVASDISTSTIDKTVTGSLNAENLKLKVDNTFDTKASEFCPSFSIDDSTVPLQSTKVLVDIVEKCDKPYDCAADGINITHNGKVCHQNFEINRQDFIQTESGESDLIPSNLIQSSVVEPETAVFQNSTHEIGIRSTGILINHVSPIGQKTQLIRKHEAQSCNKNQKDIHQETSKLCNFKKDKIFHARRGNSRLKLAPQNQYQSQRNNLKTKRQTAMGTPDNNFIQYQSKRDGTNDSTSAKVLKEDSREPSTLKIQTENLKTTKELKPTGLDSSFSFQAIESLHLKMRTDSHEISLKRVSPSADTDSMISVKRRNLNE
ncbi:BgTH12-00777 [Blumeria graminis f. sp. triticale]|uniref:BgtAc-31146 n=3 Tax=Blumeria graminis TaxID=34373 RepID=A0A9X9QFV2_BLUGR|nr:hypothetical protein BGT96224_Ac31146 [Blumeria graminis f. sp. tritici 96224]CAD6505285.1 BgTH12-00777 [Blumeria graminis f. sp. triticale]VDB93292.1 BgtAc-31146 [Blumeria graminis f. sp. tritici]